MSSLNKTIFFKKKNGDFMKSSSEVKKLEKRLDLYKKKHLELEFSYLKLVSEKLTTDSELEGRKKLLMT